jgi:hypothetical protein
VRRPKRRAEEEAARAISDYLAAVNTFRRLLVSLGLRRRPHDVTPSVADYLAEAAE